MQPTKNSDKDVWRTKYLDTLESLETQERQFRALEAVLKRLAGRLCIASLGQSGQLDTEIKRLQTVLRRDSSAEELEKITSALTQAINALDQTNMTAAPLDATSPRLRHCSQSYVAIPSCFRKLMASMPSLVGHSVSRSCPPRWRAWSNSSASGSKATPAGANAARCHWPPP